MGVFSDFYGQHSVMEPGPNLVPGVFLKILENVAIHAVFAHVKIVENHAFSQEGEGAQNCLCRKVGPFVEAWQTLSQGL